MTIVPTLLGVERSFAGRRWVLREQDEKAIRSLLHAADISPVLACLLAAKGVSAADIQSYLNPTLRRFLPEPFLFKDMEKAVARAHRAILEGERIAVFGDYDVDGSCSAAVLSDFLTVIGRPPIVYVPDRLIEGYGPSAQALLHLKEKGASLVITVDCGATADAALRTAREAGLDVIVLDHHAVESESTLAYSHVNPNQPGDCSHHAQLCAAGVTFLFVVALNRGLREGDWYSANGVIAPDLRSALDIVGLATICDVVPLTGVNRAFVRSAIARMSTQPRPGLKALASVARIDGPVSLYHCGFVLGPRINAGGRVGRCSLGVELLTATDESDAMPIALLLERHNRERQAIESVILEEAIAQAETQDNALFSLVTGEGWHSGVVGIVAGRLKERFAKPAFAIGFDRDMGRGSARSVAGIDIGALVRTAREQGFLENGGGHAMAAGFSIAARKLDDFREFVARQISCSSERLGATARLEFDAVFSPAGATSALVEEIERAGPFGAGNLEPILAVPDLRLAYADVVGQGHVRMRLQGRDGVGLEAIAFRVADTPLGDGLLRSRGGRIHAAGYLKLDRWNGEDRVQMHVQDAAPAVA